jgi:hypothetical protein
VIFLSDGTATANKKMHDATLLNLGYGFARILSCAEASEELQKCCSAQQGQAEQQRQEEA